MTPDPVGPFARLADADRLLVSGAAADALLLLRPLLAVPELTRPVLRKSVFAHLALGDRRAAWMAAQRLSRLEPPLAEDVALLGLVRLHAGDSDAGESFLRALALEPLHLFALLGAGRAALVAGTAAAPTVLAGLSTLAPWHPEPRDLLVQLALRDPGPAVGAVWACGHRLIGFARVGEVRAAALRLSTGGASFDFVVEAPAPADVPAAVATWSFVMPVPPGLRGAGPIEVQVEGRALAGSPLQPERLLSPRLQVEAVREGRDLVVRGHDAALPTRPFAVALETEGGVQQAMLYPGDGPAGEVRFAVPDPAAAALLRLPGTGEPIPWPGRPTPLRAEGPAAWEPSAPIDIVIPVYGDAPATRACVESVLGAANRTPVEVVVVDDGGPDEALRRWLHGLAAEGRITLLPDRGNLGFVRAVNRGMALHPGRDVILLNADTLVHGDWVDRLVAVAALDPQIGSVTPLSNDATILSWPTTERPTPLSDLPPVAQMDRAAAQMGPAAAADLVPLPTGVGFCMFIRRDCLDEVGWFDALGFGEGYGEENDFCRRAMAAGWWHVPATNVFVGHVGGASFGASKQRRIAAALALLERRYPDYLPEVHRFIEADPLRTVRRRLDLVLAPQPSGGRLLLVAAKLGGGTERFLTERIAALAAAGRSVVRLCPEPPDPKDGRGRRVLGLELPEAPLLVNLRYDPATELTALLDDLDHLGVSEVEIHHPMYLEEAELLALTEARPFTVRIHDYAWICPRINLVTPEGRHCGEPEVATCERCARAAPHDLRPGLSVAAWRRFAADLLRRATHVDCNTADTARRMGRYVPDARYRILPPPEPAYPPPQPRMPDGEIRICVPGAIGVAKGYDVLLACARDAAARGLPLRFVVAGYTKDDLPLLATGRVEVLGPYAEDEAVALVRRLECDAAFIPSIWPETWCYTVSLARAAGLRLFVFDMGAQGERVRAGKAGWAIRAEATPSQINDGFLRCLAPR